MPLLLAVYDNGDHTCLVWLPEDGKPIPGCRGFAIQRQIANATDPALKDSYLSGFVGFEDVESRPAPSEGWKWPIQRFLWWDYGVRSGDEVRYRVIPVIGSYAQNNLSLDEAEASAWSDEITVTSADGKAIAAFFNRGIIASQWVSRAIAEEEAAARAKPAKAKAVAARSAQAVVRQHPAARGKAAKAPRKRAGSGKTAQAKAKQAKTNSKKVKPAAAKRARSARNGGKGPSSARSAPRPRSKAQPRSAQPAKRTSARRPGGKSTGGPLAATLRSLIAKQGDPLRNALAGLLRGELLQLLDTAKQEGGLVYAVLYELNDPELIGRLKALGAKCSLILGNGAFKPPQRDENAAIRKELRETSEIKLYDRIVSSGHFAHNKFVVFCDPSGRAQRVLSGSTNWTMTGLCTQANNGIVIEDPQVADLYLQQWRRLQQAGSDFPPSLLYANSQPKDVTVDGAAVSVWFAPTEHEEDMAQARALIESSKDGILFLFFNPGRFEEDPEKWTLLQSILDRHQPGSQNYDDALYIRGVVNQEIPGLTESGGQPAHQAQDPTVPTTPVALYSGGAEPPERMSKDVLVPAAIKERYAAWEPELLSLGVMVHSKVVVLDPFGANPVVMTGSHNLGVKASSKNDDNLVIVRGNKLLAQAYALNIIAIFQEYRWRHYVAQNQGKSDAWHCLQDNDTWQQGHLRNEQQELDFWMGRDA